MSAQPNSRSSWTGIKRDQNSFCTSLAIQIKKTEILASLQGIILCRIWETGNIVIDEAQLHAEALPDNWLQDGASGDGVLH